METGNLGSTALSDLILYLYSDTLVPELFKMLGERKGIEFIQLFGGTKIEIPDFKKIVDLQRNIDIYEALTSVNTTETVKLLSDRFAITSVWVRQIFKMMKREYPKIQKFVEDRHREVRITTVRNPRNA